jgi:hypothetical protein
MAAEFLDPLQPNCYSQHEGDKLNRNVGTLFTPHDLKTQKAII